RKSKGKKVQGGVGEYTLCERCNNDTGHWYGEEYAKWARIGDDLIRVWRQRGISLGEFGLPNVFPLRFLKQVVVMCFSEMTGPIQSDAFAKANPKLAEFVLNKHETDLPSGFRFWMNFYPHALGNPTALRHNILSARIPIVYNAHGVHSAGA